MKKLFNLYYFVVCFCLLNTGSSSWGNDNVDQYLPKDTQLSRHILLDSLKKHPHNNICTSPYALSLAWAFLLDSPLDSKAKEEVEHLIPIDEITNSSPENDKDDFHHLKKLFEQLWTKKPSCNKGGTKHEAAIALHLSDEISLCENYKDSINSLNESANPFGIFYGKKGKVRAKEFFRQNGQNKVASALEEDIIAKEARIIVSTTFNDEWKKKFMLGNTADGQFHCNKHKSVPTKFMKACDFNTEIINDRELLAFRKSFYNASMDFFMPRGGQTMESFLENKLCESITKLNQADAEADINYVTSLELPKFSIGYEGILKDTFKAAGIRKVFDGSSGSFQDMFNHKYVYLDEITLASRVSIDEDGAEAGAVGFFNVLGHDGEHPVRKGHEIKFDSPFAWVIHNGDHTFYSGIVNDASE